jgi:hypothetical protein
MWKSFSKPLTNIGNILGSETLILYRLSRHIYLCPKKYVLVQSTSACVSSCYNSSWQRIVYATLGSNYITNASRWNVSWNETKKFRTYIAPPPQWAAVTALVVLINDAPHEWDPDTRSESWCGWLAMLELLPPTTNVLISRLIAVS